MGLHSFILPTGAYFEPSNVRHWLESGGYFALFGLLFSCGLGMPLPEDVPLIAAGILVSHGRMDFWIAAPLAWLGIIGGDCVLYTLGYFYGEKITKVPFIGKHITLHRIRRAEDLFCRYGIWMVAFGRMLAGIRGAMVVTAGTSKFNFIKFVIADGLAAIVSGGTFFYVGYWGGEHGPAMWARVREFRHIMWTGAAVAAIILVIVFFWRERNRSDDEEPADPTSSDKLQSQ
jgi:membrane protein DedA with SNARE-associated domain